MIQWGEGIRAIVQRVTEKRCLCSQVYAEHVSRGADQFIDY